jgi:hypothetical protein
MIRRDVCPYCGAPYTVRDGGCRDHCRSSEAVKILIRQAAEYDEIRDQREGEP